MKNDQELLKTLRECVELLSERIAEAPKGDADEKAARRELVTKRDELLGAMNALVAKKFSESAEGLDDAVAKLRAQKKQLEGTASTLKGVSQAVEIAGTVLEVVVTVIAAVI